MCANVVCSNVVCIFALVDTETLLYFALLCGAIAENDL